ncbi:MAG: hypothetical protein ACHQRM_16840 [Bacteroidia bacterium]
MLKKRLFSLLLFSLLFLYRTEAQTAPPQGFNYQAVARDASGAEMGNHTFSAVMVEILDNLGTVVYSETHASVTTNGFGLMNLVIGPGTPTTTGIFSSITWGASTHSIRVSVNDGAGFVQMGTTQLWSVPYALYAGNGSGGPTGPTGVTGATGATGPTGTVSNAWALIGNAGTNRNTNFVGTTDNQPTIFKANNTEGFRIDSAGNVGVGIQKPPARLSVYGNINYTRPLLAVFDTIGRNATLFQMLANGGGTGIDIAQNNGGMGLHIMSSATNAPAAHMELSGTGNNNAVEAVVNGPGSAGFFLAQGASSTSGMAVNAMQTGGGSAGVFQINNAANSSAALNVSTNGTGFAGNFNGTVNISGTASKLNRTQTGPANLAPIAYGNIAATGAANPATTGNISVSHTLPGIYLITIAGEPFAFDKYTTLATLNSGSTFGFVTVNASGTNLLVQTASSTGAPTDMPFTFVVYKP